MMQAWIDVRRAILPAGGLSSPPGGRKGRLQPGLAATQKRLQPSGASSRSHARLAQRRVFMTFGGPQELSRLKPAGQAEACPTEQNGQLTR